jgi:hypothetical protein
MSCIFYLSHARGDDNSLIMRFFRDLRTEVELTIGASQEIGFIDQETIWIGQELPPSIANALRTTRVAVCLISPSYLSSDRCGKEFQFLLERSQAKASTRSAILPVHWITPLSPLPESVIRLQYLSLGFAGDAGLRYLMRFTRGDKYQRFVFTVAEFVVDAATHFPLPVIGEQKFEGLPSAWGSVQPLPDVTSSPRGTVKMQERQSLRAFLCHSSSDKSSVRRLFDRLLADGFDPWLDEKKLVAGTRWESGIKKAVRESDVVVILISRGSVTKEGYLQKEIRFALDVAQEKPEEMIFLIPVRLEECSVPERLRDWQWVDLFAADGYDKLRQALQTRAAK